jgi:hypothetical protein
MTDITADLNAIVQDVEAVPRSPTVELIDQMIEKTRDQKFLVQELHLSFMNEYGYGYIQGQGRDPQHRDTAKIGLTKWNNVRRLVTKLLSQLDRRIELLEQLRTSVGNQVA